MKQDFRYAVRTLARSPGFAIAAIATLALGIGANTAVFSIVRAVLLRPPGFPEPDRVVLLWEKNPKQGYEDNPPSAANFQDWRRGARAFESLALVDGQRQFNLAENGRPERVAGAAAGADLFRVLRVAPGLGRAFDGSEETPGKDGVVVLGDALWRSRFHADPAIVGRDLSIDGRPRTVVGVMPPGFVFPGESGAIGGGAPPPDAKLWVPLALSPSEWSQRSSHFLRAVGRLRPGVALPAAAREMTSLQARIERDHPDDYVGSEVRAVPVHTQAVGALRPVLWMLLAAVAFVLLIACANIAHLLLARAASRQKEMAIRTALGAARGRIFRQLAIESGPLALTGAIAGVVLATWALAALRPLLPPELPGIESIRVDAAVLAFTLLVSLATGLLFGLAPALNLARPNLGDALAEGGRGGADGRRGRRLRDALVVGQMALALLLSVGAALMTRSLLRLESVSSGFDSRGVMTAELTLPKSPYATRVDRARFFTSLVERLRAAPGVVSAGMTTALPLSGENMNFALEVAGRPKRSGEFPSADLRAVDSGYFAALRIPLRGGRLFSAADGPESPHVMVINEALAARYFPGQDPIGRRLTVGVNNFEGAVVGVVGDVKQVSLEKPAGEEVYVLFSQAPFWPTARLVVRTAGDPAALGPRVREEVAALDPAQAVAAVRTLDDVTRRSVAQPRFRAALVGFFGVLALALSAIGLYGVLSYGVSRRRREIGIRMALGAGSGRVVRMVLSQGLVLAGIGLSAGAVAAFATTRLLSSFLFGVSPTDPLTFAGAGVVLLAVAAIACYLPARRAARIDPGIALRQE
ncbi:MAG: ABC transporter permease [Thermoanaerobaculia bacterium]